MRDAGFRVYAPILFCSPDAGNAEKPTLKRILSLCVSRAQSSMCSTTHYRYWLLTSGGTLLDGFSVVSHGIALPLLTRDFAITPAVLGFIGSALVLAVVLGAAVGGVAADRIGRKRFLVDLAILAAGSALCVIPGFAPDVSTIWLLPSAGRSTLTKHFGALSALPGNCQRWRGLSNRIRQLPEASRQCSVNDRPRRAPAQETPATWRTSSAPASGQRNFRTQTPNKSPSFYQTIRPTEPGYGRLRSTFATTRPFSLNSTLGTINGVANWIASSCVSETALRGRVTRAEFLKAHL